MAIVRSELFTHDLNALEQRFMKNKNMKIKFSKTENKQHPPKEFELSFIFFFVKNLKTLKFFSKDAHIYMPKINILYLFYGKIKKNILI